MEGVEELLLGGLVNVGEQVVACVVQEVPDHAQGSRVLPEVFQHFAYMAGEEIPIGSKDLDVVLLRLG